MKLSKHWADLAPLAESRVAVVHLQNGKTMRGICTRVGPEGLSLREGPSSRFVRRSDIARVRVPATLLPETKKTLNGPARHAARHFRKIFTAQGPIHAIPAGLTGGYAAATLPFALIGDVLGGGDRVSDTLDITILPGDPQPPAPGMAVRPKP
jgi:hypothetical protein